MGRLQYILRCDLPLQVFSPFILKTHISFGILFGLTQCGKNTICTYLSTIGHTHRLMDYQNPTTHFTIKKYDRANKQSTRRQVTESSSNTTHASKMVIPSIYRAWEAILYKAIISTSFHLCICVWERWLSLMGKLTISYVQRIFGTTTIQSKLLSDLTNSTLVPYPSLWF